MDEDDDEGTQMLPSGTVLGRWCELRLSDDPWRNGQPRSAVFCNKSSCELLGVMSFTKILTWLQRAPHPQTAAGPTVAMVPVIEQRCSPLFCWWICLRSSLLLASGWTEEEEMMCWWLESLTTERKAPMLPGDESGRCWGGDDEEEEDCICSIGELSGKSNGRTRKVERQEVEKDDRSAQVMTDPCRRFESIWLTLNWVRPVVGRSFTTGFALLLSSKCSILDSWLGKWRGDKTSTTEDDRLSCVEADKVIKMSFNLSPSIEEASWSGMEGHEELNKMSGNI